MSFEIHYAKQAMQSVRDENARIAFDHLCKALEEANREIKNLQTEVQRQKAYTHSH